jgi:hypothetical protein
MIANVKQYLNSHRVVSLLDLIEYFKLDPEILRSMLQRLIRKGQLRQKSKTINCGTKCTQCSPFMTEMYEWVEDKRSDIQLP